MVEYKPDNSNRATDSLSHREEDIMNFSTITRSRWIDFDAIDAAIRADPDLQPILEALERDSTSSPPFTLA